MNDKIVIRGARENNLKNIDIDIPRNKLVVITGVSGSGKSTLAFDTIYAEGQRRYIESLSTYARQFLDVAKKPDVDSIDGLSPSISIDQKTTGHNPRSTVGTVTEINDYLRLVFARIGEIYCPNDHTLIHKYSIREVISDILKHPDSLCYILTPISKVSSIDSLLQSGIIRVLINNEVVRVEELETLDYLNTYAVISRIKLDKIDLEYELNEAIERAVAIHSKSITIKIDDEIKQYSLTYSCPVCGFSIDTLEPRLFTFNSPLGACPTCKGLGIKSMVSRKLLIPNENLSINEGAIIYYKNIIHTDNIEWQQFNVLLDYYKISLDKKISAMSSKELSIILNGSDKKIKYSITTSSGNEFKKDALIEGVVRRIERLYFETTSSLMREYYQQYMIDEVCPDCLGKRLSEKALAVRLFNLNFAEVTALSIANCYDFFTKLELTPTQMEIGKLAINAIKERLKFLIDVGLEYLSLDRTASTLSGGEAQRIRLATQIGSRLTGVLYVLDEPSIGLHQKDNDKLINTLKSMRDLGNSLIVVEHDEETMLSSDYIIDIGPFAGVHGGEVVFAGTPDEILKDKDSLTGKYLSQTLQIATRENTRELKEYLTIVDAKQNNLKNITVKIPLHALTVVTGVSGSGKSSLVTEVLLPALELSLGKLRVKLGKFKRLEGHQSITKVIDVSQDPIGRTPRSNPATYIGVFDDIRELFASTNEAKARGYTASRFSFNVRGGRCEKCLGDGTIRVSMNFLPDVYVVCDECLGKRYNQSTLEITYKDKNISEVLDMSVEEAVSFFANVPRIYHKLKTLSDVGLDYITLGHNAVHLSGGEAQRVKLAYELSRRSTGTTLYILDEPSTGLHTYDVDKLLKVLQLLVDNDNTVVVIEHNLDIINAADYIIDLGPDGGDNGGRLIASTTPKKLINNTDSYTGKYLKRYLERRLNEKN